MFADGVTLYYVALLSQEHVAREYRPIEWRHVVFDQLNGVFVWFAANSTAYELLSMQ